MNHNYYVYKCDFRWINILIALLILSRGIRIAFHFGSPFVENAFVNYLMFVILISLGLVYLVYSYRNLVDGRRKIISPYRHGIYLEVSGLAKNVSKSQFGEGKSDFFEVNDVHFEIVAFNPLPGYNRQAAYGGVDFGEGDLLEIKYVLYKSESRIMEMKVITRRTEGGNP